MKKIIKKIISPKTILFYHRIIYILASLYYGFPAKKMIVIGVTGTKGKTSTTNFIHSVLTAGGYKTGIISTANMRIGEKEIINSYHMTMPGRFTIQKLMAQMVKEGCKYCVIETTSEGIKQFRHTGIYYDMGVFTNLTPEHLPSHEGSFEKYKETKGKMFASLNSFRKKDVEKIIIVNKDSKHADYFLQFKADKKITFSLEEKGDFNVREIKETREGVVFKLNGKEFSISLPGKFNVYNAIPGIIIGRVAGVKDSLIAKGLYEMKTIPGRMEKIEEGQDFTVFVDYAHEKESMTQALKAARAITEGKVTVLLGAEGGGRDKNKRPAMGKVAGELADTVIVSNVDPYEDDPLEIIKDIVIASEEKGKKQGVDLFAIEDRREGIIKALSGAKKGDVVLITGKGSEQSMIVNGKEFPWDDRDVVREELKKIITN